MSANNVVSITDAKQTASRPKTEPWHLIGGRTAFTRYEATQWARSIIESEDYQTSLRSRVKTGTLPPAVEVLLLQMAYGKPTEHIEVDLQPQDDLSSSSTIQLLERLDDLTAQLREVEQLEVVVQARDAAVGQ